MMMAYLLCTLKEDKMKKEFSFNYGDSRGIFRLVISLFCIIATSFDEHIIFCAENSREKCL